MRQICETIRKWFFTPFHYDLIEIVFGVKMKIKMIISDLIYNISVTNVEIIEWRVCIALWYHGRIKLFESVNSHLLYFCNYIYQLCHSLYVIVLGLFQFLFCLFTFNLFTFLIIFVVGFEGFFFSFRYFKTVAMWKYLILCYYALSWFWCLTKQDLACIG